MNKPSKPPSVQDALDELDASNTLHGAMALAFAEIEAATKSADNPFFKSKYADLPAIIGTVKPALVRHRLFFTQNCHPSPDGVIVETVLHHAGGESMSFGQLFVPANKRDPQGFGSAQTYARRYALQTAFGVPVEDDDGNAAAKAQNRAPVQQAEMPDHEWTKLVQLVEATKTDANRMCKNYGVTSLKLLNQDQYANAIGILEDRLAKMARAETDAKAGS
jgi:hypothetical protein